MRLKVRSVGLIKMLLGQGELEVTLPEGTTVAGLLAHLVAEKGEKLAPYAAVPKEPSAHLPLRIMINGRDITVLGGAGTVLREEDEVLMFVPIAGG